MTEVCPDSQPGQSHYDCWVPKPAPESWDGVDMVSWLKEEMKDGIDHEYAHEFLGPMMLGYNEDGSPAFVVYRHNDRGWAVKAKEQ